MLNIAQLSLLSCQAGHQVSAAALHGKALWNNVGEVHNAESPEIVGCWMCALLKDVTASGHKLCFETIEIYSLIILKG